jgi:Peptidase family M48
VKETDGCVRPEVSHAGEDSKGAHRRRIESGYADGFDAGYLSLGTIHSFNLPNRDCSREHLRGGTGSRYAPLGCDTPASAPAQKPDTPSQPGQKPAPGTTPVGCDTVPAVNVNPEKVIEPGSQKINVKPGSIDDVSAVGNRDIAGRGIGNWYSTDTEIKMGKMYSMQIEKSTKFITDPVVTEYINRIGQNIVKNSDCKVPFTIKVIDSDEINAFALPGGYFYVNSGLILNADEEAELAGGRGFRLLPLRFGGERNCHGIERKNHFDCLSGIWYRCLRSCSRDVFAPRLRANRR